MSKPNPVTFSEDPVAGFQARETRVKEVRRAPESCACTWLRNPSFSLSLRLVLVLGFRSPRPLLPFHLLLDLPRASHTTHHHNLPCNQALITAEAFKMLKEDLATCYKNEGVNHYERCQGQAKA